VKPSADDVVLTEQKKRVKLGAIDKHLKAFEYKAALNLGLAQKNPETVVALFEEMADRGVLELALSNRSPQELMELLKFLEWKAADHRFAPILTQVLRVVLDMYSAVLGLDKAVD